MPASMFVGYFGRPPRVRIYALGSRLVLSSTRFKPAQLPRTRDSGQHPAGTRLHIKRGHPPVSMLSRGVWFRFCGVWFRKGESSRGVWFHKLISRL